MFVSSIKDLINESSSYQSEKSEPFFREPVKSILTSPSATLGTRILLKWEEDERLTKEGEAVQLTEVQRIHSGMQWEVLYLLLISPCL